MALSARRALFRQRQWVFPIGPGPAGEKLVIPNPGVETCDSHCRGRPWEPEKFASSDAQLHNLEYHQAWIRSYSTRGDAYGLKRHGALSDAFPGAKQECGEPSPYDAV